MKITHAQQGEIAPHCRGRARLLLTDEIFTGGQSRNERNAEHLHAGEEIGPQVRAARGAEGGRAARRVRHPAQGHTC